MNAYEKYYISQAGGALPVFAGARIQKGHGLGSLFRGLARVAAPLFIKGAKAVGKQMLHSGLQVMNDVADGQNFKQSLKNRSMQGTQRLVRRGIRTVQRGKGVSLSQAAKRNTSRVGNKRSNKVGNKRSNKVVKRVGVKRKAQYEDKPAKRPKDIFS